MGKIDDQKWVKNGQKWENGEKVKNSEMLKNVSKKSWEGLM